MLINRIITVVPTDESGPVTEPVTLSEVKQYGLRQTDTYDDAFITSLITEARMWIEKYTGLYIIEREITVHAFNQAGGLRLPGPITSDVVLNDTEDEVIDAEDYELIGDELLTSFENRFYAVYNVGYESVPEWVKNAMYAYIAWAYEERGDKGGSSPERCAAICRPYRRVNAWA